MFSKIVPSFLWGNDSQDSGGSPQVPKIRAPDDAHQSISPGSPTLESRSGATSGLSGRISGLSVRSETEEDGGNEYSQVWVVVKPHGSKQRIMFSDHKLQIQKIRKNMRRRNTHESDNSSVANSSGTTTGTTPGMQPSSSANSVLLSPNGKSASKGDFEGSSINSSQTSLSESVQWHAERANNIRSRHNHAMIPFYNVYGTRSILKRNTVKITDALHDSFVGYVNVKKHSVSTRYLGHLEQIGHAKRTIGGPQISGGRKDPESVSSYTWAMSKWHRADMVALSSRSGLIAPLTVTWTSRPRDLHDDEKYNSWMCEISVGDETLQAAQCDPVPHHPRLAFKMYISGNLHPVLLIQGGPQMDEFTPIVRDGRVISPYHLQVEEMSDLVAATFLWICLVPESDISGVSM